MDLTRALRSKLACLGLDFLFLSMSQGLSLAMNSVCR